MKLLKKLPNNNIDDDLEKNCFGIILKVLFKVLLCLKIFLNSIYIKITILKRLQPSK